MTTDSPISLPRLSFGTPCQPEDAAFVNAANPFFNAQHSPLGAFASFTLGALGAKGGFGVELGKPADQNVFIGVEDEAGGTFSCLPFYAIDGGVDGRERFDVDHAGTEATRVLYPFAEREISRTFTPAIDSWQAGDLTFTVHTPVLSAPDPDRADREALMLAYVPALAIELTVDNRECSRSRRVLFGLEGNDPYWGLRRLNEESSDTRIAGIACGRSFALASDSSGMLSALGFSPADIVTESHRENLGFALGNVALLLAAAPSRQQTTFRYVLAFHRAGIVTTGMEASYFHTRFFPTLESVIEYGLGHFDALRERGAAFDRRVRATPLNAPRRFALAQAVHSYYGSTELLDVGGEPFWAVNEGEYCMLNTMDLLVDHLRLEMELNPWTVRNQLDWFSRRYAYEDRVRLPGETAEHPGGISFTHDMGVRNHFARPGHSAYERAGLTGCFSYMSHEELVNWTFAALVYEKHSGDAAWGRRTLLLFEKVLASLMNRDHPDPAQRDGVMSADSSRCGGGAEITTYDSLDPSLGQARNNLYLAVKTWGVYVGLADLFARHGVAAPHKQARWQASLAAETIAGAADAEGLLPAILHENNESRILPAIEGLLIPHALGLSDALAATDEYGALIRCLKRHFEQSLRPGVCLFPGGGWKISSSSTNTWLSKIYLCQFLAERVLGVVTAKQMAAADRQHAGWLLDRANSYWAWSDQIVDGAAKGSRFYPRGVTALWWCS